MKLLKAIDHIEVRLTAELTLPSIAASAGLSAYHFSRMFHALTGETVTSYVRRRRLTEAARRLLAGDARLIDVAIEYGFDSQAAFSRAFKREFAVPPGTYRRMRRPRPWIYRPPITADELQSHQEFRTMTPRIVDKPAFNVVGLAAEFSNATKAEIPDLWRRFRTRVADIPGAPHDHYFGLCVAADGDNFTYVAAAEVDDLSAAPADMFARQIGEQTYAVFTVQLRGKDPIGEEISRANRFIWTTWLPKSDYSFARAPDFEYYDSRFDPAHLSGEIDVCVPVCKASA